MLLVSPGTASIQHQSSHNHAVRSLETYFNLRLQQSPYIDAGAPDRSGPHPPAGAPLSTCACLPPVCARHLPVFISRIVKTADGKALAQARGVHANLEIPSPSHYNRTFPIATSALPTLPFSLPFRARDDAKARPAKYFCLVGVPLVAS